MKKMLTASIQTTNQNIQGNLFAQKNRMQQKMQINFGYAPKPLLQKGKGFFINCFDNVLKSEKGIGQFASNLINYGGKFILPPLMILAGSKFTHEDKDSVKSSMLVQPIDACSTFGISAALGYVADKIIVKSAELGKLGKFFQQNDNLKQLKSHSLLGMTFLAIPLAAKILNWALPKIKGYDEEDYKEKPIPEKLYSDLYAARLIRNTNMSLFAEGLRPQFGSLTGGHKNV